MLFFLAVLGLYCWAGFFLFAASRGCSLVWCARRLIAVASLVELGLQCTRASAVAAPWLWSTGSIVAQGCSWPAACGIFLDWGLNEPCLLNWQVDSLPPSYQGSPQKYILERLSINIYIYISCKLIYLIADFNENMLCEDSFIQQAVIQYNVMFHTLKIK